MDNKHHHIVFKKRCEVAFLSKIFTLPGQIYSICWESTILNINVRTVDHVWLLGNMNVACSKSKPLLCGIVSYLFRSFPHQRFYDFGVSVMAQWLMNPSRNHEVVGSIPGLAPWVGDLALLWAVVQDCGCSSHWTPCLRTSICCRSSSRKGKKKTKKKKIL